MNEKLTHMLQSMTCSAGPVVGVVVTALSLGAQSTGTPTATYDSALTLSRAFIAADSRKDPDAAMALFATDPDVTIVSNGVARASREDFRKALVSLYGSIQSLTIVEDSAVVSVMGPEAAVVTALYRFTQVDTAGRTSTGRAAITYACQRRGAWRIVHYHFSRASS